VGLQCQGHGLVGDAWGNLKNVPTRVAVVPDHVQYKSPLLQLRRPVGFVLKSPWSDVMAGFVPAQVDQLADQLPGQALESRSKHKGFLVFGDWPAPGIVAGHQDGIHGTMRLLNQESRRHELGIGGDRISALALEPRPSLKKQFPPFGRHGKLSCECSRVPKGLDGLTIGICEFE
jgi:hypothetical protein